MGFNNEKHVAVRKGVRRADSVGKLWNIASGFRAAATNIRQSFPAIWQARQLRMHRRWLWLLVPLVALLELGAHLYFSRRAPAPDEYYALVTPVQAMKRAEDALVIAPAWAAPLARRALGDRLWPLDDLAQPSFDTARRVLEVSILGHASPETENWPIEHERQHGPFQLRLRTNPAYRKPLFEVVDAVARGQGQAFRRHEGTRYDCRYKTNAPARTGGLHGHLAYPRKRFVCGKDEAEFVGVTIIDDQHYRPRRCVWAHPPRQGTLWLRFEDVAFGSELLGHAGLSYFTMRDGVGPSISLSAYIDGKRIGNYRHHDEYGWAAFSISTRQYHGTRGRLEFRIESAGFEQRDFCFSATTL